MGFDGSNLETHMKNAMGAAFAFFVGILMACAPVSAHHGSAAYDMSHTLTIDVTVTQFIPGNPHSQMFFDSKDEKGNVIHWACELQSPSYLLRIGWTRNIIKPGDHITIIANPNKKENVHTLYLVKAILPDGRELPNVSP